MTTVLEEQLSKIWSFPIKTEVSQALGIWYIIYIYRDALCYVRSFLLLVVMPGATFVASDRSVRSDALCSL